MGAPGDDDGWTRLLLGGLVQAGHQARFPARRVVRVDDPLRRGLIQRADRRHHGRRARICVAGVDRAPGLADIGLERRANRPVADALALRDPDALDGGLNVCQCGVSSCKIAVTATYVLRYNGW